MMAGFLCAAGAFADDDVAVSWDTTRLEVTPGPHEEKVSARFEFVNDGQVPVEIERIRTPCGCTAAEASNAPEDGTYGPGEGGNLEAEVHFSRSPRIIEESIYVTLRGGDERVTRKLTVAIDAAPYITADPTSLVWPRKDDEQLSEKTVELKVHRDDPIRITDIRSEGDADAFDVKTETVEAGKLYRLTVNPARGAERADATFTVLTDYPSEDNPVTCTVNATILPDRLAVPPRSTSTYDHLWPGAEPYMIVAGVILLVIGGGATAILLRRGD
ncbi:MAG: DUF1573 domain-containing protein [Planctomycetota bacterium]